MMGRMIGLGIALFMLAACDNQPKPTSFTTAANHVNWEIMTASAGNWDARGRLQRMNAR